MGTKPPFIMAAKAFLKHETISIICLQLFKNQDLTSLLHETSDNKTIPSIACFELTKNVYLQQNHARFLLFISYTNRNHIKF